MITAVKLSEVTWHNLTIVSMPSKSSCLGVGCDGAPLQKKKILKKKRRGKKEEADTRFANIENLGIVKTIEGMGIRWVNLVI